MGALNWGVPLLSHDIWIHVYGYYRKERKMHIQKYVGLKDFRNYCSVIRMKQSSKSHIAEN